MSSPAGLRTRNTSAELRENSPDSQIQTLQTALASGAWERGQIARQVIGVLFSIMLTLFGCELLARFVVAVAHPLAGPSREFDIKFHIAKQPPAPRTQGSLIFLGGSFTARGIYPELVAQRLEEHGYKLDVRNLGTPASSNLEHLFLLKTAIDAGRKPVLVVYDLRPDAFNQDFLANPTLNGHKMFRDSSISHCFGLSGQAAFPAVSAAVHRNVYLIRYRNYFKDLALKSLGITLSPNRAEEFHIQELMDKGTSAQGWAPRFEFVSPNYLQEGTLSWKESVNWMRNDCRWDRYTWCPEYARPVQELCERQNIPLLFLWLPEHPRLENLYRHFNTSPAKLHQMFAGLPKGDRQWFLDMHDADREQTHFFNKDHLNIVGAIEFTKKLSDSVMQAPYKQCFDVLSTQGGVQ